MCGINGFNWEDKDLIASMNRSIKHRGPDDQGTFCDNISFGQVRLSILDLSEAGHQPMFYSKQKGACSEKYNPQNIKNSNLNIIFNGEIYNYKELREELINQGYLFSTQTDTEVILASYLEYGFDCVKKFNGMWAFCIHDKTKNILFCSRDRLGVKPFYYYNHKKKFVFSSEIKGILAHKSLKINILDNIDKNSVNFYFSLGFIPSPYSIYKNVYKLEARQNMIFDLKKNCITQKWYYYDIPQYNPVYDKNKLIKEGKKILKDAIKLRMRSDVPVGAFLSGGLDSSTIVGIMKDFTELSKLHTFSIGFEGKYDETKYINIVKNYFQTKHHHYYFKKEDFEGLIQNYSWIYDEPFADFSGFPTYKVSSMAKKYVTVCLSGDGGDEIFGGYMNHVTGYRMDYIYYLPLFLRKILSKLPAKKNLNGFASLYLLKEAFKVSLSEPKFFYSKALIDEGIKPEIYRDWTVKKLEFCLEKGANKLAEALRLHDLLYNSLQDNFLVKVDRASMAHALEVRSPFLDYRFIEYSQKIPTRWKQDLFRTKKLMREIIKDIVPKEIVYRGKQGFTPPLEKWVLEKENIKQVMQFNKTLRKITPDLAKFFDEKVFKEDNKVYTFYKIRLFLFGKWMRQWVK